MSALRVSITPLQEEDLPAIMEIEKSSFISHWPESAFMSEIANNRLAHYFVAKDQGIVVGYSGIWLILDEAHITTLAVHSEYRRKKIGEQLLIHLLTIAAGKGARWATLEVRESNVAAQELYKKYGFITVGNRKNYYQEENENAVIMWTGNLRGESFKRKLTEMKGRLAEYSSHA